MEDYFVFKNFSKRVQFNRERATPSLSSSGGISKEKNGLVKARSV